MSSSRLRAPDIATTSRRWTRRSITTSKVPIPTGKTLAAAVTAESSPDWREMTCSLNYTGNTGWTNAEMWTKGGGEQAWDYVTGLNYTGQINWSSFVAQKLNFSSWQEYQCQSLSDNNCMYQQACTNPGSWMVMNSISNLWEYHYQVYNLIGNAHESLNVDLIVKNFCPQFDYAAWKKKQDELNFISLGVMIAIGAVFGFGAQFALVDAVVSTQALVRTEMTAIDAEKAAAKADGASGRTPAEIDAFHENQFRQLDRKYAYKAAAQASLISMTQNLIFNGAGYVFYLARYKIGNAQNDLAAENVLSDLASNITDLWKTTQIAYVDQLFNGSRESIDVIGAIIANGTWLTPWNETTSQTNFTADALPLLQKHMYGMMIPLAWASATKDHVMPVVIMAPGNLSDIRNITNILESGVDLDVDGTDDDVNKLLYYYEGYTFWLLTPYKSKHHKIGFRTPPGGDELIDSQNVAGGLTFIDIIISSYLAFKNDTTGGTWTWDEGVRYPGFFKYPVCVGSAGMKAAAQSYKDEAYSDPC